ncbi:hypothetical protein HPP92_004310 [Vanilla planifolia]|uniref:ABC transmembrane type-1 domain-containing protein n=1 Tax=Vanilla planifolia TaxID=51239 RepID=A0A835VED2_VANPL|nr:hypothetical protein HPP92_004310 [Vanilla planifolia]
MEEIEEHGSKEKVNVSKTSTSRSIFSIFSQADAIDYCLMALGCAGAIADGVQMPMVFFFSGMFFNDIGSNTTYQSLTINSINRTLSLFLYTAVASLGASFLEAYCWTRTAERQGSRMRVRYLSSLLRQEVAYFDLKGPSTSEIVNSVSSDSLAIQDVLSEKYKTEITTCTCFLKMFGSNIQKPAHVQPVIRYPNPYCCNGRLSLLLPVAQVPNLMCCSFAFVGGYIVAFILDWRLAMVAFPMAVLLLIPGMIYGRVLLRLARKTLMEYNKANEITEKAFFAIRTVYAFTAEQRTLAAFSSALKRTVRYGLRQGLTKGFAIGSTGIMFGMWAFMVWYGGHLTANKGSKGGNLYAAGIAIINGGITLGSGLSNVKYFVEAIAVAERMKEVIDRKPAIDLENREGEEMESLKGEVEFREVRFSYPARAETEVLKGFSMKVLACKTVALVGESGSGKSTAIALLQRFYDPTGGKILLDGVEISRLRLKWLRAQMGLVSQEPVLFATTIKENILFGKEDATLDEVIAATKAANAHDFISHLPWGYDTQVESKKLK